MTAPTVRAAAPRGRRPAPPPKPPAAQRWRRRGPLLPALLLTIVLTQIPMLLTVFYSLFSQNLLRPGSREFVGLANYADVLGDRLFRNAVFNTVVLTASTVLLSMALGIGLAILLDKKFLGRSIVRTLLITPFLVMPAAAALLWKTSIFNPVFGLLNWVLSPFGVDNVDWVSRFPMASIILVLVWQWTPFMMLIVLAGLQSQSPEVLEAATVDGAGPWSTFGYITLPHLRQFIELGILLGSIFIVQTFDAIFMITQGGPGQATTNLPYFIYQESFRAFDVGEAAAAGVLVVVATIIIATFALRVISNLFREEV
ncbi:carbohydrate ABC transporter membrane protein 1 (CUT1 family) [Prauserella shujinwangii]|uniref:Carbohydrate ABC transporter membrane protein 1 (CUT1 family) n=1 Tax=Prauserella shujinwangii TaxID=1453103 RepID=A0A2T0LL59_9PSEU|nr:sugar ABC transporter permease [Prauserella shujinwangii]PRX43685.1 carbohydrate ABC transporter membrane protein 1 (CUT1 family) [Prauserella shujinwangii]